MLGSRRDGDGRAKREGLRGRLAAAGRGHRDADVLHQALTGMVIGDARSGEHLGRQGLEGDPVRAAIALSRAQRPDRGHDLGGRASGEGHGSRGDLARLASQPGIRHGAAGVMRRRGDQHTGGKERVGATRSLVVAGHAPNATPVTLNGTGTGAAVAVGGVEPRVGAAPGVEISLAVAV